jgi:hypothetical protein
MEQFPQQEHLKTLQNINSFYIKYKEVPEYILLEWELINLIIDYTLMLYTDMKYDEYFSFNSKEIKDYYEKINNPYKKNKRFNKIYGKKGIYMILAYRNGVKYEIKNDIWYIYPKPFLKHISQFYEKDKEIYGNNFDKPLKKII